MRHDTNKIKYIIHAFIENEKKTKKYIYLWIYPTSEDGSIDTLKNKIAFWEFWQFII